MAPNPKTDFHYTSNVYTSSASFQPLVLLDPSFVLDDPNPSSTKKEESPQVGSFPVDEPWILDRKKDQSL